MTSSLVMARRRAEQRRAEAAAARERVATRTGRAGDELTTMSVDPAGNPVRVEFAAEVVEATTQRWAQSLQAVHRRAREAVGARDLPSPSAGGAPEVGPVTEGKPLAAEQVAARRATDQLLERFADLPVHAEVTGSAREVWITVDSAKQLVTARATPAALQRGSDSLARAVVDAWADARRKLLAPVRSGGGS